MIQKPYIYTFDAELAGPANAPLTNAANYDNLIVNTQTDASFLLRRYVGMSNVMTTWRQFNQKDSYIQGNPVAAAGITDYVSIPELLFDPGSQIRFNAGAISLGNRTYATLGSVANYWSQVAFQGVKTYNLDKYQTPYEYYDYRYSYPFDTTITYAGRVASAYVLPEVPRQYSVLINNGDFELLTISMVVKLNGSSDYVPCDTHFKLMLVDQFQNQLMSTPVLDSYINYANGNLSSVWPVPGVVYPVGSFIRFSLTSLLIDTQVPATLQIAFGGKWRRPANGFGS